jgi:histidinol-phosphate/aromatic aminotransferase/cobyric acid decarboxylase-like protein
MDIVTNPQIIAKVRTKTQWANVSYLAVGAALTALEHENYFSDLINEIGKRRESFRSFLQDRNYTVLPSYINAVLIRLSSEEAGTRFAEYLQFNNFVISHGNGKSNVGLNKSFVRISIGTPEEMNILQEVIAKYRLL